MRQRRGDVLGVARVHMAQRRHLDAAKVLLALVEARARRLPPAGTAPPVASPSKPGAAATTAKDAGSSAAAAAAAPPEPSTLWRALDEGSRVALETAAAAGPVPLEAFRLLVTCVVALHRPADLRELDQVRQHDPT